MDNLKVIFFLILFWILAYTVTFVAPDKEKEYEERGITVSATITDVQIRPRGQKGYQCTYVNQEGQKVQAYLILNKLNGDVGEIVQGKYLPENPSEVYCSPSKILKYGLMIVIDGITILLTVFIIVAVFGKPKET